MNAVGKGDSSTVIFTKSLLEKAMEQARLSNKEAAGEPK
jgi:hypothetical protein